MLKPLNLAILLVLSHLLPTVLHQSTFHFQSTFCFLPSFSCSPSTHLWPQVYQICSQVSAQALSAHFFFTSRETFLIRLLSRPVSFHFPWLDSILPCCCCRSHICIYRSNSSSALKLSPQVIWNHTSSCTVWVQLDVWRDMWKKMLL